MLSNKFPEAPAYYNEPGYLWAIMSKDDAVAKLKDIVAGGGKYAEKAAKELAEYGNYAAARVVTY